jgi:hypothetical protein|tara:strand:+ start:1064 stop:1465 length:402 start_codon:yes stop_codon:yes gene_type:complete
MGLLDTLIGPVTSIIDKIIPDKDQAAKLAHEIATMADTHAQQLALGQLKVNEAEAASGSLFKGGWRPAIGWICGLSLFWAFILQPFIVFFLLVFGVDLPPLPQLNTSDLMPILLGMLGLGGLRTFEKIQKVTK